MHKPDSAQSHLRHGAELISLGRYAEAELAYRQALSLEPALIEAAYGGMLTALVAQQKYGDIEQFCRAVLARNNAFVHAHYHLGVIYGQRGNLTEAEAHFHKTIACEARYTEAYCRLGEIQAAKGRTPEAIENFRRALKVVPSHALAQYQLSALGAAPAPPQSPKSYVTSYFDNFSATFDEKLKELGYRVPVMLNDAIREYIPETSQKLDVLDLGCGTGLMGSLLRDISQSLTGIDLSPGMIAKAQEKNIYDSLVIDDIVIAMHRLKQGYDLILAADVLVYIGSLNEVFSACWEKLRPGGLFAFTTEISSEPNDYTLQTSGRYAHRYEYLRRLAEQCRLEELRAERVILRKEMHKPIHGWLMVLRKTK